MKLGEFMQNLYEICLLLDLLELNLSDDEFNWNATWKMSNCTGIASFPG